jgi:hypothetical protein
MAGFLKTSNKGFKPSNPTHVLKLRVGEAQAETLTGLWPKTTRAGGSYLGGKDRDGNNFYVWENKDGSRSISCKQSGADKPEPVCTLTSRKTKDGEDFLVGDYEQEGVKNAFFVFKKKAD